MSDTEKLSLLGANTTNYKFDKPSPEILETFKYQHPGNLTVIPFCQDRDEFTSLCPKTGQPDTAKIEIIYIPNELCVESKSLKLYLFSFRNSGEFHEDVCNRIANDLFNLLKPRYLRVYGDFAMRGGLAIRPMVHKLDDNTKDIRTLTLETLAFVEAFDLKSRK